MITKLKTIKRYKFKMASIEIHEGLAIHDSIGVYKEDIMILTCRFRGALVETIFTPESFNDSKNYFFNIHKEKLKDFIRRNF